MPGVAEPIFVGRDVPFGENTRPGRFAIAYLDDEHYPEADFIIIEQKTPDVLWQPELLAHPNGVTALRSVTVASDDPAATIARLTQVLGKPDGSGFTLSPGRLDVVAAADVGTVYPEVGDPRPVPKVVAVAFSVVDIAETAGALRHGGVSFTERAGTLRVGPADASGAVVNFVTDRNEGAGR